MIVLGDAVPVGAWEFLPSALSSLPDLPDAGWLKGAPTVAGALAENKIACNDIDANDFWFRTRFSARPGAAHFLFEALAGICDVYLNGAKIARSENMFVPLAFEAALNPDNVLHLHFCALRPLLKAKRPRPRWKTRLVADQTLRFFRQSLLGRMPGWSNESPIVGPIAPVKITQNARVLEAIVRTRAEGDDGYVSISLKAPFAKTAELQLGAHKHMLQSGFHGELRVPNVERWWPHTHGAQPLYEVAVKLDNETVSLGRVGFRDLQVDRDDGAFTLRLNGERIFFRGGCHMPNVIDPYAFDLKTMRDAGANMVRLTGPTLYPPPEFFSECDRLGICVWQDFMFANFDYPSDDTFVAEVTREAAAHVHQGPSLVVLCGSSEVEQQAAMMGFRDERHKIFHEVLPEVAGDIPYVSSSPTGGALPFSVESGVAHYYGVGAYLRPLEDARRREPRFAAECLAFSNMPNDKTLYAALGDSAGSTLGIVHPQWKAGVPRDNGASWDFEDVRDHYLQLLFKVDARLLRTSDWQRYVQLSRVITGEVMARTFSEWRRKDAACAGALIWFWRDLKAGAGWGVEDNTGAPKACFHFLKRVWQPRALLVTDEGLDGLAFHAVNESHDTVHATLSLQLFRDYEFVADKGEISLTLAPHSTTRVLSAQILGHFSDLTYAYRFGPPSCDFVSATLTANGEMIGEAFHFPLGMPHGNHGDLGMQAKIENDTLTITTKKAAVAVAIEAPGFQTEDDYFHLAPGATKRIHCGSATSVHLHPLNGRSVKT